MESFLKIKGEVEIIIEDKEGSIVFSNKTLRTGRIALAASLANQFGGTFEYYIQSMSFGSGGTVGSTPRFIDDTQEGLFGPTILSKSVISSIDPDMPNRVIFTSVVTFDEVVGQVINEIALQMKNGDFFSMATFGDISKTSEMQLTFNWSITFV